MALNLWYALFHEDAACRDAVGRDAVCRDAVCRAPRSHPPFLASPFGDKEDVALRGLTAWRRRNFALMASAQPVKQGPSRRGKQPLK